MDRPLRIGYVWQYEAAGLSPVSATALHMEAVVRAFRQRGHQVRVVTLREGKPHCSEDLAHWQPVNEGYQKGWVYSAPLRLFERGVRRVQGGLRLPYLRFFDSLRFGEACKQALRGCDVVYERFWFQGYGGLLAARKMGIPLVYEVNGDLVEEYRQLGLELSGAQWAAIHRITRRMFGRAGRVVAVSEPLRQRILQRWKLDPRQVAAISNGAQVEMFTWDGASEPEQAELRSRYGLGEAPLVIFVGSFKPWHGLDLLVQAFARVAAANGQARLVFVGDGPVRPELEGLAAGLGLDGRVVFTGAIPHVEVAALLGAAQAAVVNPRRTPATESQSPLKLFEYMAAGKAIVAPALPNLERILADGENALLVAPDDPEALAAALQTLLGDEALRNRLGQRARRQALAEHSWDATAAQIESIFYELVKAR